MGGGQPQDDERGAIPDSPGGPTVLVVDDDPVVRADIAHALGLAGIAAVVVADGKQALRLVAGGTVRPTVLLTDIEMPRMGGVELVARMHALRPAMRIVMMTGDPVRADVARERTPILATVLVKPVTGAELVAAIRATPERAVR